ncbi:hypothetical protein ACFPMF_15295 [Larkinella bovis]|uniref:Uncharacterized protein n=2 Tax=Larkinella bovis TaxID=683041 RepID=A0ABW0IE07_9BACT
MEVRELVDQNSFTKELGHFIAHPERGKGLCFDEINYFVTVINQRQDEGNIYFSDNSDINSIEAPIFKLLTDQALHKLVSKTRKRLGKKSIKSKDELANLVNDCYTLDPSKKYYILTKKENTFKLLELFKACLHYTLVAPLTTGEEIIKDFNHQVSRLYKTHMKGFKYNDEIAQNQNDLIVCIFSLLQSADFTTYNKKKAKFIISHEPENREQATKLYDDPDSQFNDLKESLLKEKIQLYLLFDLAGLDNALGTVSFIPSGVTLGDYLTQVDIDPIINSWLNFRSKTQATDWSISLENDILKDCYTQRDKDGKLMLMVNHLDYT